MRTLLMMLLASSLWAGDWSREDTIRESVVVGALYVDWTQTRQIQAHPERWEEMNPGLCGFPCSHCLCSSSQVEACLAVCDNLA
jgi:hypothetical protein